MIGAASRIEVDLLQRDPFQQLLAIFGADQFAKFIGQAGGRAAHRPGARHPPDGFRYQLAGAGGFAHPAAHAGAVPKLVLAVAPPAVAAGAGHDCQSPALLGASQQADHGIVDHAQRGVQTERFDRLEGRGQLRLPVETAQAKAGPGNLFGGDPGALQGGLRGSLHGA